jgi:hypothetical protein
LREFFTTRENNRSCNQLFEIAKSESIPLVEVPICIKQKFDDKQKLEEKINEADAILQSKNVDIGTIIEYNQLKEGLSKHNLSLEDPLDFCQFYKRSNR